jgi:hypothetical protein
MFMVRSLEILCVEYFLEQPFKVCLRAGLAQCVEPQKSSSISDGKE